MKTPQSDIVVWSITVSDFNQRGQLDFVDFQSLPEGEYNFILHYQEHLIKFIFSHLIIPLYFYVIIEHINLRFMSSYFL